MCNVNYDGYTFAMSGEKCLDFLRYCLVQEQPLQESANKVQWMRLMDWAVKQAVVGVVYGGILKSGKGLEIPFDSLMKWVGYVQQIELRNKLVNKTCSEVVAEYEGAGYRCMILKGQGNALMYPHPLLRMSGDIDLLIYDAVRKELIDYVRSRYHVIDVRYHHVEYIYNGIPVELHFIPCQMNNLIYHRRLIKWLKEHETNEQVLDFPNGEGSIPVPSWNYNVIFQLAHMMHHFFDEGIGLRQMIDYYYLLKSDDRKEMADVDETLRYLNLFQFASAVMYIMKEVLGLEEKYLIVPMDEKRGKTLLREIMHGGNFGHSSGLAQDNAAKKYLQKTWRNMKLVKEYPAEALCEPVFRTWHYFWRMVNR